MENNTEVIFKPFPRSEILEEGEHYGIKYEIKLIELSPQHKHHTGYVYWHRPISEDEASKLNVHGGVTYNYDNCIGFDCAHFGDSIEKCDVNFVRNECKSLIEELKGTIE